MYGSLWYTERRAGSPARSGTLPPHMATEPVARGRVVSGQDVYDGYALERSCIGEDDEDFQAQTQHLLEQVYDAIDLLSGTA